MEEKCSMNPCSIEMICDKNQEELESKIPFNKPFIIGNELKNIDYLVKNHYQISGNGIFTKECNKWLENKFNITKALLTHSCTAALEMAAILSNVKEGDEVIMPSFTFVSTANAFVLRGATPVFVDIRPDTLNIDETKIEQAITKKTKAIVPVHYAGQACEMDTIMEIAKKYNLLVIEDAAQGIFSTYKGQPLGTIGHIGALSFHETKNIISGEGGAILINDENLAERAEIIWEKGTNRANFFRGQVDKYTWVDIGSSYLPSDIIAAYLYPQLEHAELITSKRLKAWHYYHEFFEKYEKTGILSRPFIAPENSINAHMYYVIFNSLSERTNFINFLKKNQILSVFHYIPLHNSPAGEKYCRTATEMQNTINVSDCLVRMPLYYDITSDELSRIFAIASTFFEEHYNV